uniref:Uncharacterized protein n=1 Tax=Glossina pallidipes TaxID=7398 RepID=A0A1B0A436_GLOPL
MNIRIPRLGSRFSPAATSIIWSLIILLFPLIQPQRQISNWDFNFANMRNEIIEERRRLRQLNVDARRNIEPANSLRRRQRSPQQAGPRGSSRGENGRGETRRRQRDDYDGRGRTIIINM